MSKASGYWLGAKDGTVYGIGKGQNSWPAANFHPAAPIAGIAAAATGGYWLAGADGGVFSGNAPFYGSAEPDHPSAPIVAIAATPDGAGYWLLGADGGVFSFGDAGYHGRAVYDPVTCYGACAAPSPLPPPEQYSAAQPVGMASTPDGGGYWIAQSDGAVLAFGDAESLSTEQAQRTRAPIVGLTAAPTPPYCGASSGAPGSAQFVPAPPQGYWLVGADGGVFSYGDAQFEGSAADERLVAPIVGMAAQPVSVACPATRRTRSAGSDAQLSGGGLRPRQQAALGTE
ncbi:MAG TPA: hypothetical protein VNF50_00560 [Acidimicrobiales bacterium]|nr:hypothetical protein [Acidimicrobiales bacterium]